MNELHEKVLDFILAYHKKHPDFVCWLRQRDTKDRLSNGFWFQGNETYAFVGLYDASGGSNMTRSVGLVFWYDTDARDDIGVHLEIVFNEERNPQMLDFYKSIITDFGPFVEKHGSKYTKMVGFGESVFQLAEQFLDNEKPKIDTLVKEKGLQLIFIDKASFETKLKRIADRKQQIDNASVTTNENNMEYSLNNILYGPPGTGKTYHTINRAIEIINPEFVFNGKSRSEIREEYNRLLTAGNIEFCTFHQSMSYEDFIEGIKPLEPTDGDTYLKYKVQPGIFKRLIEKASYVPDMQTKVFSISEPEYTKAQFYKMSLGDSKDAADDAIFQYCIDNSYIALGWGDDIDFSNKSEREITQMVSTKQIEKFEGIAVNYFIHYIKPGDYVIISRGNSLLRAIGRVTGTYEYRGDSPIRYHQFRKVEWVLKNKEIPVDEFYDKAFSQASIYQLDKKQIKKDFFVKATSKDITASKPGQYVLIIDEINRGNVSAIFGELITLIEDDKRKGNKEELEVRLPYSQQLFSVPNNLYIIGTMNTADRSVEALDTALRRRFSFEETKSNPELLGDKMANGISLKKLLQVINERIAYLLDEDHQIGHSYFYDLEENDAEGLKVAFRNKIIPLLKEYFYNDYEKIMLVLGTGFVSEQKKPPVFAGNKKSDIDRSVFTVKDITNRDEFINAIKITLNEP